METSKKMFLYSRNKVIYHTLTQNILKSIIVRQNIIASKMKFSTFCTKCKKTQYSRFLGWLTVWVRRRMFCFSTWENTLTAFVWQKNPNSVVSSFQAERHVLQRGICTCICIHFDRFSLISERCQTNAVSVFSQLEKQNMRLCTQTVSHHRNREYCGVFCIL